MSSAVLVVVCLCLHGSMSHHLCLWIRILILLFNRAIRAFEWIILWIFGKFTFCKCDTIVSEFYWIILSIEISIRSQCILHMWCAAQLQLQAISCIRKIEIRIYWIWQNKNVWTKMNGRDDGGKTNNKGKICARAAWHH